MFFLVEPIKTEAQEKETVQETEVVPEVKIAFPEVKFPTPEIKVIQSDDTQVIIIISLILVEKMVSVRLFWL